ncbi:NUDIX hydrolase [Oceanobacter mangrovi]|uniref:NUDIX hydrolase n=1 Tax=Oceanobacter mangrovi TaxID=2862510 RepID=UPI001C8DCA60|nr:NUDIX hydrolase [Oceanobacter mangrovi]
MKYCSQCGGAVEVRIPEDDNRPRHVCTQCNTIFYSNPRIVAGTIPVYDGKILLCKRAIEPRYGYWTLPGGFMENHESTEEAALRETWEEAAAKVTLGPLYSMASVIHISQVHLFFKAELPEPVFASGPESLEVRLFEPAEIPWDELAFATVSETLRRYLQDPSPASPQLFDIRTNQG